MHSVEAPATKQTFTSRHTRQEISHKVAQSRTKLINLPDKRAKNPRNSISHDCPESSITFCKW